MPLGSDVRDGVKGPLFEHVFHVIRRSGSELRLRKIFRAVTQLQSTMIACFHDTTNVRCTISLQDKTVRNRRKAPAIRILIPNAFINRPSYFPAPNIRNMNDLPSLASRPAHLLTISLKPTETYVYKFMSIFYFTVLPEVGMGDALLKSQALWLFFAKAFFKDFFCKRFNLTCDGFSETEGASYRGPGIDKPWPRDTPSIRETWGPDPWVPELQHEEDDDLVQPSDVANSGGSSSYLIPLAAAEDELYNGDGRRLPTGALAATGVDHRMETVFRRVSTWIETIDNLEKMEKERPFGGKTVRILAKYFSIPIEVYRKFKLKLKCKGMHRLQDPPTLPTMIGRGRGRGHEFPPATITTAQPMGVNDKILDRFYTGSELFKFTCDVDFKPSRENDPVEIDILFKEVLYDLDKRGQNSPPIEDLKTVLGKEFQKYCDHAFEAWYTQ